MPNQLDDASAARFLEQATFGPTASSMQQLKAVGIANWIKWQLSLDPTTVSDSPEVETLRSSWLRNMVSAPDQLRQRMVFALSQIFVISSEKNLVASQLKPWLDTLNQRAFGNFKLLLREITLNPAMGLYLDMVNSEQPNPNQNFARELMQLFTIGTVQLKQDGNPDPAMKPTYTQAQVEALSHALSGWTYAGPLSNKNTEYSPHPLQANEEMHSIPRPPIAARDFPWPTPQDASFGILNEFDQVMDGLFWHQNLPPFIATRLIRHFVCSNPSPGYIKRVADVFAGHAGTDRGDLAATLTAILTDEEARPAQPNMQFGHLRDPILHITWLLRALDGKVLDTNQLRYGFGQLGQVLMAAPSVFNYYSPLHTLPGNPTLFAPEFQIFTADKVLARSNLVYSIARADTQGVFPLNLSLFESVINDPEGLVNLVDTTLLQGRMSTQVREIILDAVKATFDHIDFNERVRTALFLTALSAEGLVCQQNQVDTNSPIAITVTNAPLSNQELNDYKALVCIYLAGGNDGNRMVMPADAKTNVNFTRSQSGVDLADPGATQTSATGIQIAFHKKMPEIEELFNNHRVAVILNVGSLERPAGVATTTPDATWVPPNLFSHLDQTQQAIAGNVESIGNGGWGGRLLDRMFSAGFDTDGELDSVSLGAGSEFVYGSESVPGVTLPANGQIKLIWTDKIEHDPIIRREALLKILALESTNPLVTVANKTLRRGIDMVEKLNAIIPSDANGNTTSPLSTQLHSVAFLIKNAESQPRTSPKRQVYFVSLGGFDTHANQAGTHSELLGQLSEAIGEFQSKMDESGLSEKVTCFTMSDFGRALTPNSTKGTDHGWGNHQLVVGGAVKGDVYGSFPNFASDSADSINPTGIWIPKFSNQAYAARLAKWFGAKDGIIDTVLNPPDNPENMDFMKT